jgi:hypothetical protein
MYDPLSHHGHQRFFDCGGSFRRPQAKRECIDALEPDEVEEFERERKKFGDPPLIHTVRHVGYEISEGS